MGILTCKSGTGFVISTNKYTIKSPVIIQNYNFKIIIMVDIAKIGAYIDFHSLQRKVRKMSLFEIIQGSSNAGLPIEKLCEVASSNFLADVQRALNTMSLVSFDSYCSHTHRF